MAALINISPTQSLGCSTIFSSFGSANFVFFFSSNNQYKNTAATTNPVIKFPCF
jgi:hypothetical protein